MEVIAKSDGKVVMPGGGHPVTAAGPPRYGEYPAAAAAAAAAYADQWFASDVAVIRSASAKWKYIEFYNHTNLYYPGDCH